MIKDMNIQFLFLKKVEKKAAIYLKTIEWIKKLTIKLDNEEGSAFLKFVKQNLKLPDPYQVFIIYNQSIDDVVGIASLIPDDQGVGKECNISGIWIAGVNIKREYRNKGYGNKLIENVDKYLNNLSDKPIRINLFSNNPIAIRVYEKIGFKYSGLEVLRMGKINKIYSKRYV